VRIRLGQSGSTTAAADCQLFLWQAERTTRRHSRDDPREDVGVGVRVHVGVGPVEFQLYTHPHTRRQKSPTPPITLATHRLRPL